MRKLDRLDFEMVFLLGLFFRPFLIQYFSDIKVQPWTCEYCTYVNNPGISVCAMCCKTTKNTREVKRSQKNKDTEHRKNSLKRDKTNSKGKKNYNSSDDNSDNNNRKSKSKNDNSSDGDSDNDGQHKRGRRRNSREKKKGSKGKNYKQSSRPHSDGSDIDNDAVAAYYAVRVDKSQGMTVTQKNGSDIGGHYDSSSESASAHNPKNRPIIDAPAPAKGILKKVASNPSLAKLDGMSEASGVISEVGYITNKLTQKLKARGQHNVLDSPAIKHRTETPGSGDIWQQEKENWLKQKEELKAWAATQGQGQGTESAHHSPKVH